MRLLLQKLCVLSISISLSCVVSYASAQVMQSTSYRIQDDSINVGGGYGSSTSYHLEDTAGEAGTGQSSSAGYTLSAGYQQMHDTYLALTGGTAVTLTPAIGGITGGTSNGSTTFTATTDSSAGYQLTIAASTSPAMQSGAHSIADYATVGANPDFNFITDPTDSQFGFSPEGLDVASRYKDDGASCNTGSGNTSLACWDGLSTTPRVIVSRTSSNHPLGTDTVINFRVGIGGSVVQPEGVYTATTTVTLLPL